jgi:rRNA-processing protein FCF1
MAIVETPTTWYEDIVDGTGRIQPVLLDCVRAELDRLVSAQGRRARAARVALEVASGFESRSCGGAKVDDEIISAANSAKAIVATADDELRRAANASHLRVVFLRKGRVAFD